uniref:Cation efflux protein transmembrane domain-containing protein n=1 Tax=Acrobeloides nanus TaxID=290746 RepID=A0A914DUK1_9BILA
MIVTLPCESLQKRQSKRLVLRYYKDQEYLQECHAEDEQTLKKDHAEHMEQIGVEDRRNQKIDTYLANASIFSNILILLAKLVAAYFSHSLSVISTVVDSVMDLLSGVVIWFTIKAIAKTNKYDYPIGRARLEPLAVLIVAIVMIFASLLVIYQSIMSIAERTLDPIVDVETIAILTTGAGIKAVLYILCRKHGTVSATVLAQDQGNDVITNLTALAGAYLGH